MSSDATTALIAGGVSIGVSGITAFATYRTQERRLRQELRLEFMAEEALRSLLDHPDWRFRTFRTISKRVRGFPDDELRQLLIRAGALCFERTTDGEEMWGLRSRNEDKVAPPGDDGSPVRPAM
jgi:hypothetical protein